MAWKVVTLDNEAFADACHRLQQAVEASGYRPDMVLSIVTGGLYVGNGMFAGTPHLSTILRRPTTSLKTRLARSIVAALPRAVQNRLRIAEAEILKRHVVPKALPEVHLPFDSGCGARRVLVVDDAVDSGRTLAAVLAAVRQVLPQAQVRSAVITVTTDNHIAEPDYALWRDHTLVRFPWSMDA